MLARPKPWRRRVLVAGYQFPVTRTKNLENLTTFRVIDIQVRATGNRYLETFS